MTTYQEVLDYLFEKLPMYSRIGAAAYKNDLTNTIKLCEALDNPQNKIKTIHIAGTNGKGSTSHMLAAVLQANGYKTGLYTSPHLYDFRERIKINGELCTTEFVIDFTHKIKPLIEEISPSFFEITVAMAFYYFAIHKVDIAVIEVGLGGRLDSTNIITPVLCIITNIGWDHMNMLGNTLPEIAAEKAGIIKENIPVIVAEYLPETKSVFALKANTVKAPICFVQDEYYVSDFSYSKHLLNVSIVENKTTEHQNLQLDLLGIYQTKNILSVVEAIQQLKKIGFNLEKHNTVKALSTVKKLTGLFGRWDVIQQNPTLVLDVAHNINGIEQLVEQIEITPHRQLHIVLGLAKDKEIDKILALLPKNALYYFTKAQIPRALDEMSLQYQAKQFGLNGKDFSTVSIAVSAAKAAATTEDLIVVCGSVFVVAEVNR